MTTSPTKSPSQLEIPTKADVHSHRLGQHLKHHSPISSNRKSPKRRAINRHPVASSSSSSESIVSAREMNNRSNKG